MIDNKIIKDNHQGGIERIVQKKVKSSSIPNGKMGLKNKANWKREYSSTPPKKA